MKINFAIMKINFVVKHDPVFRSPCHLICCQTLSERPSTRVKIMRYIWTVRLQTVIRIYIYILYIYISKSSIRTLSQPLKDLQWLQVFVVMDILSYYLNSFFNRNVGK